MKNVHATYTLLAASVLCCIAAVPAREVVNFDFAWRFHKGEVGLGQLKTSPSRSDSHNCSFPTDQSGVQCWGLHNHSQATTAAACAQLCCTNASGCRIWQFSAAQQASEGKGCYNGVGWGSCKKNNDWLGGSRPAAPTPKPAPTPRPAPKPTPGPPSDGPAQPDFDDSAWQLLDVPHDFIIGGAYNQADPASGQSYLPRSNGWYRKQ